MDEEGRGSRSDAAGRGGGSVGVIAVVLRTAGVLLVLAIGAPGTAWAHGTAWAEGAAEAGRATGSGSESGREVAPGSERRGPAVRVPSTASSESRGNPGEGEGGPGLDALLQLPSDYLSEGRDRPAVAGATESEWRRRFRRSRAELEEAAEELAATKRELDQVVESGGGSQWAVAPAVGGASGGTENSPLSFRLREELKRDRDRVEAARKGMRQLEIEADLAGVPRSWRGEPESE